MKRAIIAAVFSLVLFGCASVDQGGAEKKAVEFIQSNVKFFARVDNLTVNIPAYTIKSLSSIKEGNTWVIFAHISTSALNETKDNDVVIKINSKGKVTEFNGKQVP